jgi:D-amino peptidase
MVRAVNIYISADMEGVAGVTHPAQCRPSHPDYDRYRRLLTHEINAAVEGAIAGGAQRIVVNDGHLTMTNIVIEELHPSAELISGSNKLLAQMEGIDETFDGTFFVGYHEGDGIGDGVISHTLMSAALRRIVINGVEVDEAGLNARIAGAYGVPVLLLTGDDCVCAAASRTYPGIHVAPVKRAVDRLAAQHQSVRNARALIAERATAAVESVATRALRPVLVDGTTRFEIEMRSTAAAHACLAFPGVERVTPTTIAIEHDDYLVAFRFFWGLASVALASQDGLFGTGL